jgi:phosphopantothenoylcysteine decarboxylase/phosphopantothenate--cysteine ligase
VAGGDSGSAGSAPAQIVLGVSGGIAAYKVCYLLRLLTEAGHQVRVIPTEAALKFVGAATWEALSGQPVSTTVWENVPAVEHVRLGKAADLVIVAPATADLLARATHGQASDLLTSTLLMATCPVIFAPEMHTQMWEHPATVSNVATLRARGNIVIEPAVGRLTGKDSGKGRLPEPAEIFEVVRQVLRRGLSADLAGRRLVVTAGGTREPLDPVRYLGNRSSGKQGYAFARTAVARGAQVTLISANVELPAPAGAEIVRVSTTAELREAVLLAAKGSDAVIMAAAPADFRPSEYADQKIKKRDDGTAPVIELTVNPDIAAEVGQSKEPGQVLVAFAAETQDALANAERKLVRKKADLIVVNDVGTGRVFGSDGNEATIIGADGTVTALPRLTKDEVADAVWDRVVSIFHNHPPR